MTSNSGMTVNKELERVCEDIIISFFKVKGKGHPITGHQGPRGGIEV
jgi:hypothetical protein